MRAKTVFNGVLAAIGSLVIVSAYGAAGDERFSGGSFNGYDHSAFYQCDSNTVLNISARSRGGSFDGYASYGKNNTTVASGMRGAGMVLVIH